MNAQKIEHPKNRNYKKALILIFIVMALGLTMAGCASQLEPPTEKKLRLAFIVMRDVKDNPFWLRMKQGAEKAGRELDIIVDVYIPQKGEAGYELREQKRILTELLEQPPDGLLIAPVHADELTPLVEQVVAAGIPVMTYDAPLFSEAVLSHVSFDNLRGGRMIGEWVVEQLEGQGQVVILEGAPNAPNAVNRLEGFLQGLEAGNIRLLDQRSAQWSRPETEAITAEWLRRFERIDAILAANDRMALGAADAVAAASREGIIITGIDGNPNALYSPR